MVWQSEFFQSYQTFHLTPQVQFTANPIAIEDVLGRKQKVQGY